MVASILLWIMSSVQAQPIDIAADDLLFSKSGGSVGAKSCSDDPRRLRENPAIGKAIELLALPSKRLKLLGCESTEFATGTKPGITNSDTVVLILYPVDTTLSVDQYAATVLHELGHAWQIFRAGSLAALRDGSTSERIELGADFLVGILGFRTGHLTPDSFQTNRELVGRYREASDQHGSPLQRSSAFRLGYFYDRNNRSGDLGTAYSKMQGESYRLVAARAAPAVPAATDATTTPPLVLDKLNACSDVNALWQRLDTGRKLGECRPAESALEKAMAKLFPEVGTQCFLAPQTQGLLAGFACVNVLNSETRRFTALTCYRAADAKRVASFEADHAVFYAEAEQQYLQSASHCSGYSRDASPVSPTVFSWHIQAVAKPRFGYNAVRHGEPPGSVLHGFAQVDERLSAAPRAIEVVELRVDNPVKFLKPDAGEAIGAWALQIDDAKQLTDQLNSAYRKANAPARALFRDHDIRRVSATADAKAHLSRLNEWIGVIAREFARADMQPMPQSEIERFARRNGKDFRTLIQDSTLYGLKGEMTHTAGPMKMYYDQSHADCTEDGGIAAGVFSLVETDPTSPDYGSVGVFLIGVGRCSRPLAMRLLSERLDAVTQALRHYLEKNP